MCSNKIKKSLSVVLGLLLIFAIGCNNSRNKSSDTYDRKPNISKIGSQAIAQNNFGNLTWDEKNNNILLECNGKMFSTTPYDFYSGAEAGSRTKVVCTATVALNYIAQPGNAIKTVYSSEVLKKGRCSAEKIKSGIKVTYYFDSIEAVIPVRFTLENGYVKISVDTAEIKEGEQKLYQIALAPYFASVLNGTPGGYVFVPSGSGALIYTDSEKTGVRQYKEEMYHGDASINKVSDSLNTAGATMPVFGVKSGDTAMCGIIDGGAESCSIVANAGDEALGYASAYPLFSLHGNNLVQVNMIYDGAKQNTAYYADEMINSVYSVRYYPLFDDEANYTGMAKTYQKYLKEQKMLKENADDSPLYVQIIGGMMTDQLFLGIPYQTLESATTLEQAEGIIEDIGNLTGTEPVVQLKGFGTTGLDVGKIGSGFKISSVLGGYSRYKMLIQKHENVFTDFDLVRYRSSTFRLTSAAKTANNETAYQYDFDLVSGSRMENRSAYKLLARSKLNTVCKKMSKTIKNNQISGISLSSLGRLSYSDYEDSSYYISGNMSRDVFDMLSEFSVPVMTEASNSYAAAASDHVIEAPTASSKYNCFDADVPVFEIVFKGHVSMSAPSGEKGILDAVESGMGICFTLADHYNIHFAGLPDSQKIAGGIYGDVKDQLILSFQSVSYCLKKIADTEINEHYILQNGVTKTVFSNGTKVFVNKTDNSVMTEAGEVPAKDYIFR